MLTSFVMILWCKDFASPPPSASGSGSTFAHDLLPSQFDDGGVVVRASAALPAGVNAAQLHNLMMKGMASEEIDIFLNLSSQSVR